MAPSGEPIAALRGVTMVYREGWRRGEVTALSGLSLAVRRGEIYGFLGPNGAGKTTALHCLLGLLRPREGTVHLFGEPAGSRRDLFRRIGYMPEEWSGYDFLTAIEMLETFADLYGVPRSERRARVGKALERVGLSAHGNRKLRRLSKGMRQRASLAQAILAEPLLLILDEPTKELDPLGRRDVRVLLRELADAGASVLISSHLLSEVERICDRVGVLSRGRLVAEGDLRGILVGQESRAIRFTMKSGAQPPAGAERDADGCWRWRAGSQEELYARMAKLSSAGAAVQTVQPETVRLEDYFIQVVEGP